jgi:hypothetical protein
MTRPTLSDDAYRRTEGVLFRYAKAKQIMARLESEIAELERQIVEIEKLIAACGAIPGSVTANYSGMPAGGDGTTTTVERATLLAESRLSHLQAMHQERCAKRDEKTDRLQLLAQETAPVEFAYQMLEQRDQHIFTQRYFYERTNEAIGAQLHYDERTVRRRRNDMLIRLAEVLEIDTAPILRRVG